MSYNNASFGVAADFIVDSPYVYDARNETIIPPPPSYHLVTNSGERLLDNDGNPFIVD